MLFQRFFDELEYVGHTIVLAKGIVDEKITSIKVNRLIRQSDKIEAKKAEELEALNMNFGEILRILLARILRLITSILTRCSNTLTSGMNNLNG